MTQSSLPSRRSFLQRLSVAGATAASVGLSGCIGVFLGGGNQQQVKLGIKKAQMPFASQQKRITQKMATHTASDRSTLVSAVTTPGATVWIPGDATIDMSGETTTPIAPNVTIASNRGLNGGTGGLIKTDEYDYGLFISSEGSCRLTGLRLKGPRTDYFDPPVSKNDLAPYSALGFKLQGHRAIVDYCEVFGWTFAGIALGSRNSATQGWIHHNSMHNNQMNHLGYPMELFNGAHLIEWNVFDANRHSIAGFGYPTNGYEARFNLVGPNAIQHAFDMHYLGENLDSVSGDRAMTAGQFCNVHHNVFTLTSNSAFSIQGYPKQFARFAQNWCAESKGGIASGDPEGVVFSLADADVRVKDNKYGQQAVKQGQQWLQAKAKKVTESSNRSTANATTSNSSTTGRRKS